ncbi:hypothetical protein AVEN_125460-1 [Araneus ventricosus]|uniref:Uncharacterized protein n=1 Tax=Araneus ventricosus TaxID=182803 RepID=A0A4Y2H6K7_ARAVE|nr:hypothetical protein AVEN_125460-1 [Araneus ventricosus]
MTAGIILIARKLPSSPNTSGRATLTKKARVLGVKSITLKERRWKFLNDFRTLRAAIVFCLKGRMGRSRIDRVKPVAPKKAFSELFLSAMNMIIPKRIELDEWNFYVVFIILNVYPVSDEIHLRKAMIRPSACDKDNSKTCMLH